MGTKGVILTCGGLLLLLLAATCGSAKTGVGGFCEQTSDCQDGLVCKANICQNPDSGDCIPACQPEVEACFEGHCVPVGDPNDKDGDGSPAGEDCNDFDGTIFPSAHEYCDGTDNDCDGITDEDCPACTDDQVQPCGTDIGECTTGVQTCLSGIWGGCSGTVASIEMCDSKDNDCDGLVDEPCPCTNGEEQVCSVNVGTCAAGTQTCENGIWSGCRNGELPRPEICDGVDNDCDGVTDDGFNLTYACTGVGECGAGVVECAADLDVRCSTMPGGSQDSSAVESCDAKDNDCDGLTDEGMEADTAPNTCPVAKDLGGLPDNGSEVKVVGNLWPDGDEDWYKVTATDDLDEETADFCDRFHFRVRFLQNPGTLVFDVYVDGCAGENVQDGCLEDTEYDHAYDGQWVDTGGIRGQCECRPTSTEGFNICASEPKVFYVRIHGGPNHHFSCANYELSLSNGMQNP